MSLINQVLRELDRRACAATLLPATVQATVGATLSTPQRRRRALTALGGLGVLAMAWFHLAPHVLRAGWPGADRMPLAIEAPGSDASPGGTPLAPRDGAAPAPTTTTTTTTTTSAATPGIPQAAPATSANAGLSDRSKAPRDARPALPPREHRSSADAPVDPGRDGETPSKAAPRPRVSAPRDAVATLSAALPSEAETERAAAAETTGRRAARSPVIDAEADAGANVGTSSGGNASASSGRSVGANAGANASTNAITSADAIAGADTTAIAATIPLPAGARIDKRAASSKPQERADAAYRIGLSAHERGDYTEAARSYAAALKDAPALVAARVGLASVLIAQDRLAEAETLLQAGLALDMQQPLLAQPLARLLADRGELAAAIGLLQAGLPGGTARADYRACLAALLQRAGRQREAAQHFDAALRLQPGNGVWWMGFAIALAADGRTEASRIAFTRARNSGSLSPELAQFVEQRLQPAF